MATKKQQNKNSNKKTKGTKAPPFYEQLNEIKTTYSRTTEPFSNKNDYTDQELQSRVSLEVTDRISGKQKANNYFIDSLLLAQQLQLIPKTRSARKAHIRRNQRNYL